MGASRFDGDLHITGNLSAGSQTIANSTVNNAMVSASAAIAASKLQHQHRKVYAQPNTAATTETRVVWEVRGATATLLEFRAGSIGVAIGNSTVTIDLKKNGTTVLNAVITLDVGNVARIAEAATITVAGGVAGDVYEIVIVATIGSGTLPTGVFVVTNLIEDYQ